jgi:type IX secretion system PorP/SprF family membrane protein
MGRNYPLKKTNQRAMKKISAILVLLVFTVLARAQQDPQYSMYMFNQIGVNPAYAGSRDALSANLFYRNQWAGFPGSPKTEVFNIHAPLQNDKMGLGLQFVNDQLGPTKSTTIMATYAYRIKLKKGHLCLGLSAGVVDQVIDYSKIEYKDLNDTYSSMGTVGKMLPTFDFGGYYYTKSFYVGISSTHLNQPAYSSIKDSTHAINAILQAHTFITIGKAWTINENLVFRPSLMVKMVYGAPLSIDADACFILKNVLWLGVGVRSGGAAVGIVQYSVTDKLRIGYAYDVTLNGMKTYAGASHEIFLGYDFDLFHTKTLSPRYF